MNEECKHPQMESLLLASNYEVCPDCGADIRAVECKGCGKREFTDDKPSYHNWWRTDYYDIPTGHWCDECYADDHKYTYKRDAYFDPSYAGESMDEEEF